MHPVKKISRTRTRSGRAHHALKPVNLVSCPKCGKPKLSHAACAVCGYVSGKTMLTVGEKES